MEDGNKDERDAAGSNLRTLYDIMHDAAQAEEYGPTAEERRNGTAKPYRNRWDKYRNYDTNPGGFVANLYAEDSERATRMCPQCHGTYSPWVARCPMCLAPTPGGPLDPDAPPAAECDARWVAAQPGPEGVEQINKLKRRSNRTKALQRGFHTFVWMVEEATLNVYLLPADMYRRVGYSHHTSAGHLYGISGMILGTLSFLLYMVLCGEALYDTDGNYVSRTLLRPARRHRAKFRRGHYSRDKELKATFSWLGIVLAFIAIAYAVERVLIALNPEYFMAPAAVDRAAEYSLLVRQISALALLVVAGAVLVAVLAACFRFLSPTIEYYPAPVRPALWSQREWKMKRRW